jgi:hypothetical protein
MGELYAAVPAALSVTLVAAGSDRIARWYVAGLVAGLAWTISLQLAAAAGMLAVLGLSASARVAGLRAVMAILGVLTVVLLIVGAGVASGTTPEAWDALVTYNGAYRLEAVAAPSATLLPWTFLVLLPLIVLASMALIQARRRSADRLLVMGSMAWIALAVMTIGLQGRLYGHYAISLVVPLGLLAGIGFRGLAVSLPHGARRRILLAAPIAMTVVLSLIVGGVAASMEQRQIRDSNERIHATAPEVEALTRPGDTILVWGNEPRLYEAAGRAPALRYVYLYPILTDGYVTPELIAELVRALTTSPPAVVIDAGSPVPGAPGFPPLLIDRPVATDGRDTDLMDPLRRFIEERYCPVSEVAGWPIYQYVQAGPCTS